LPRRRVREAALRVLFQADVGRSSIEEALEDELKRGRLSESDVAFLEKLVLGLRDHIKEADERIARLAIGWTLDRMGAVDRNILRLAVYELLYLRGEIPVGVAINEAVELAKKYGDEKSGSFINGILASVARESLQT